MEYNLDHNLDYHMDTYDLEQHCDIPVDNEQYAYNDRSLGGAPRTNTYDKRTERRG